MTARACLVKVSSPMSVDEAIIVVLNKALSSFVMACMDKNGNPQAPTKKQLMEARSMVSPNYPGTLVKQKESNG